MTHTTAHKRSGFSQTRKRRHSIPTTLPELKASFAQLRKSTHEIIRSTKETKQRIRKFQACWKDLFNHPVDAMAAESYIRVMESGAKRATRRSKGKKQNGGAAPIDFQTRPGVDGVHGSFPQYLTGGLSFYNTINQEGMFKGCGTQDITPAVPDTMGSNKAMGGGGTLSDIAFVATTRPAEPSVPANLFQDMQNAFKGQPLGASPLANQNPLKYV